METYIFSEERFSFLPCEVVDEIRSPDRKISSIRLRPGKAVQLTFPGGDMLCGMLSAADFEKAVLMLMGHSLYARQQELDRGFFMLPGGSRAGICGRFAGHGPRTVSDISSVCIRIAREVTGCADKVMEHINASAGTLVVSPPGLGKTTLIRDIARRMSYSGKTVCIIDERGEIAACKDGIPQLDVGPRTDVFTGIGRPEGIIMAVRSCAPDVLVTDEVGDEKDAYAISEALRSGVGVVASAHGTSLDRGGMRGAVMDMIGSGMFGVGILMGPDVGEISEIRSFAQKGSGMIE